MRVWRALTLSLKAFLIPGRVQRDIITNVRIYSLSLPDICVQFSRNLKFPTYFDKNTPI